MQKKHIQCPLCHGRIIDANEKIKTMVLTEDDIKLGMTADYFSKCPKCKNEIGIKKVG